MKLTKDISQNKHEVYHDKKISLGELTGENMNNFQKDCNLSISYNDQYERKRRKNMFENNSSKIWKIATRKRNSKNTIKNIINDNKGNLFSKNIDHAVL